MALVGVLLALCLSLHAVTAVTEDEDTCSSPLGMEAGSITNNQITASSIFSVQRSAFYARLNRNEGDGGWTAAKLDAKQYLVIDLEHQAEITAVATQGRYRSTEWVSLYTLQYSDDGNKWSHYTERGSRKTFEGNTDARTVKKNELTSIIARYIRFTPTGYNKQMSMRVEIFGCLHDAYTATFDGSNYAIYDVSGKNQHLALDDNDINFRMKTNRPNGIIMAAAGTQTDYMVIELIEGSIVVNLDLGSSSTIKGATVITAGSLLDDNHWHNVVLVRNKQELSLTVDRHTVRSTTEGDFERLDLDRLITFGGAVNFDEPGVTEERNFIGCLENIFFNKINILRGVQLGSSKFRQYGTPIDFTCQDQVVVPVTFPTAESYLRHPGRTSNNFTVLFDFRSYDNDGLLVYNMLQDSGSITVSLNEGRLQVDVKTATAMPADMLAGDDLNDGQWHAIRVEISNNNAKIKIDGREWNIDTLIAIQTTQQYYLGGTTGDVLEATGFRGCMKDIYVGPTAVDLLALQVDARDALLLDVSIDTCAIVDRCAAEPCEHGGECYQYWEDFACDCSSTGYGGATCHTSQYERSCEVYKQLGRNSASYFIDPDLSGPLPPFRVNCRMNGIQDLASTVVSHRSETRTEVGPFSAPGAYKLAIDYYGVTMDQIGAMVDNAESCEQEIKYECMKSRLLNSPAAGEDDKPYGWWVSRNHENMYYWGGAGPGTRKCACGIELNCVDNSKWCNCDIWDSSLRVDEGFLVDKEYLPVQQLRFGDITGMDSEGHHTLGKLICSGDLTLENEATFRSEQAHMRFPIFSGTQSGDASFEFKTTAESGVFLYNRGDIDYIKVELVSELIVQFTYNVGNGRVEVKSQSRKPLNDNKWHLVKISRNRREAVLQVDTNGPVVVAAQKGHYLLNLKGNLYVGSTDRSTDGYVGCMRALVVNGKVMDLAGKARYAYGVSPGCIGRCESSPCFNGAACLEEYSGFQCNCTETSFDGPLCATEVGALMGENDRIRYTFLSSEALDSTREEIRVGFRTERPQGTLIRVQSRDFDDYFDISLNEKGNIVVRFDFGGDDDKEVIDEEQYADGQYHDLQVTRDGRQITLQVDTYGEKSQTLDLRRTQLNSPGTLFIGKYDDSARGFIGCISRVEFNNVYPLKKAFATPTHPNVVLEGKVMESMCGVEPSTLAPTTREPYPPTSPWPSFNNSNASPLAQGSGGTNDAAVIGCVVAVLLFALIVLLFIIGRYIARHKGSYDTNEAKGAEDAPDADTAVQHQPQVEKKKEWYI